MAAVAVGVHDGDLEAQQHHRPRHAAELGLPLGARRRPAARALLCERGEQRIDGERAARACRLQAGSHHLWGGLLRRAPEATASLPDVQAALRCGGAARAPGGTRRAAGTLSSDGVEGTFNQLPRPSTR